jgi:aurora kinase
MAARTLEARFEHLTVNDENDLDGTQLYQKKVSLPFSKP